MHDSLTLKPEYLVRLLPRSRLPIIRHNSVIMLNLKHIAVLPAKCLLQTMLLKQTRSVYPVSMCLYCAGA